MKFGHTLEQAKRNWDVDLQGRCFDYKGWKKAIKYRTIPTRPEDAKNELLKDCLRINETFKKEFQNNVKLFSCCGKKYLTDDRYRQLLEYSTMNKNAIYKICKKMQKRCDIPGMASIYYEMAARKDLDFMNSVHVTWLRLHEQMNGTPKKQIECPICLDVLQKIHMPIIITRCGHAMCFTCASGYTGITGMRGTLRNKILYATYVNPINCPVCRAVQPLSHVGAYNFYPCDSILALCNSTSSSSSA